MVAAAVQELLDAADRAADREGPFCAVVGEHPVGAPAGTWSACVEHDGRLWSLAQVAEDVALRPRGRAGIGAVRSGLDGARLSLGDAELAWQLSGTEPVRFTEHWVLASLAASADRLDLLLRPGREVAQRSDYLADAVQAYADHGFSVVGAARALHVHPNTVIYRLDRWRTLTGWDPRSFHGLAMSVASLRV